MVGPLPDYYVILGVARTAGPGELRRAYRLLALQYHPDRAGVAATGVFQRVAEAYGVLSDPEQRREYDGRLREVESRRPSRAARRTPGAGDGPGARAADVDREQTFSGPGGHFTWSMPGAGPAARADDSIDRLSGTLDELVAQGAAHRCPDGTIELVLSASEAAAGGTAAVDAPVDISCPTCFGLAGEGKLWCRRCIYAGTVRETVTVCIPVPPHARDGITFHVPVDPTGKAPPLRVRLRVR